jgi:hypothetical protein
MHLRGAQCMRETPTPLVESMHQSAEIATLLAKLNECQGVLAAKHRDLMSAIEQGNSEDSSRLKLETDELSKTCAALLCAVQQALDRARKRISGS